jgi:hypothetical protein
MLLVRLCARYYTSPNQPSVANNNSEECHEQLEKDC